MSHVSSVDIHVTDLDALEIACDRLGLELQRNKPDWAWWGTDAGDSDLAPGFDRSQFGIGEHAIKVKGTTPRMGAVGPWEIGLVKREGQPGWSLLYDQWGLHGRMLEAKAGANLVELKRELATEVTMRHLYREGYRVTIEKNAQGQTQIVGSK